jgi:hypothetical protein
VQSLEAVRIWYGSDGKATSRLYNALTKLGPAGEVAVALFRANKCSARAKLYRGGIRGRGSYKSMAYERKDWSIGELCRLLEEHARALGIVWGWKADEAQEWHTWVIYVELPNFGQVSFHTSERGRGPAYVGEWDGKRASTERICAFCNAMLVEREAADDQP